MEGCYTWTRECLNESIPNPCAVAQTTDSGCAVTPVWFWLLAGALGFALLARGKH
jgi:hypothetical protein